MYTINSQGIGVNLTNYRQIIVIIIIITIIITIIIIIVIVIIITITIINFIIKLGSSTNWFFSLKIKH